MTTTMPPNRAKIVEEVCCGNSSAFQFCASFVDWCHWIDDLVDKDTLWTPEEIVRCNLRAILVFSDNEFFQQNKVMLMALIVQSFRAYSDSNKWMSRADVRDRRAADILKSLYHEVIWHVAYLVGGWDHMSAMTSKYRSFDYDCKQ